MMTLTQMKDKILDEVDGAIEYMTEAIEHKGTPDGCTFRKMSEMELEHANALTKMLKEQKKSEGMTDEEYGNMYKTVLDKYADSMAKYEAMKKVYYQV